MFCHRFNAQVQISRHAYTRMAQRHITEELLIELLESGEVRYKDEKRFWTALEVPGRQDNLLCAAVVLEEQLVVKTVMHHFEWEEGSANNL